MVHVVLSPEWTSRVTERRLWQRRSEAQQIARDAGLRGGYMVVHPYRTTDELDQLYAEAVDHGLPGDHGKWRFARELTAGRWSHLERYLSVSPHYHVIGPARDVTEADTDGWVVKNIRSLPRHELKDPEPYEALAGVAWYLRSHAAHQQGRTAPAGSVRSTRPASTQRRSWAIGGRRCWTWRTMRSSHRLRRRRRSASVRTASSRCLRCTS
jgi:hypothetical protein